MPVLSEEVWLTAALYASGAVMLFGILHFIQTLFAKPPEPRQYARFVQALKEKFPAVIWQTTSEVEFPAVFAELSLSGLPCRVSFVPGNLEESYLKFHRHSVRITTSGGLPGVFFIEKRSLRASALGPQIVRFFGFKGMFGFTVVYSGDRTFDWKFEFYSLDLRGLQNIMSAEQKKGSPLFEGEISVPTVVMLEKLAQDKEFRTRIGELLQGGCHQLVNHEGRVSVDMEFHTPNTIPGREELEQVVKRISHLNRLPVWRAALEGA